MRRIPAAVLLIVVTACAASAQHGEAEREILKLNAEYERAQLNRDAAFFERVLADDYTTSYETGTTENKAEYVKVIREEKAKPTYKLVSMKSEDLRVKVMGEAAVLTGTWVITTAPLSGDEGEPQTGRGRYTSVYEKRDGRWVVVAEHMSVAPRDRKLMERQVLEAGRGYNGLMKRLKSGRSYAELESRGDIAALKRVLADEYIYTGRDGEVSNKTEDLESYKANTIKVESAEILEQRVRVIGNTTAVETGAIRYRGSNKGTPFDITKRYTTTWVRRDFRWQIVADHTSKVSP